MRFVLNRVQVRLGNRVVPHPIDNPLIDALAQKFIDAVNASEHGVMIRVVAHLFLAKHELTGDQMFQFTAKDAHGIGISDDGFDAAMSVLIDHGIVERVHPQFCKLSQLGVAILINRGVLGDESEDEAMTDEPKPDPKKVFIIHGRNQLAVTAMETFVRALGLEPILFKELRGAMKGTPTVAEIVTRGMKDAQGVIAIFTGDEFAELRPDLRSSHDKGALVSRWQSRPNVIFEAGMAFGQDRDRVVFVLFGDVQLFTDVDGVHVLRPNNDPSADRDVLRRTLESMGCALNSSSSWMTAGDFNACMLPEVSTRSPFEVKR